MHQDRIYLHLEMFLCINIFAHSHRSLCIILIGTLTRTNPAANRQRMIERYGMVKEFGQYALALPPYFNLLIIPLELRKFFNMYTTLRSKNPGMPSWGLLQIFFSRNDSEALRAGKEDAADGRDALRRAADRRDTLRLIAFNERARAAFLDVKEGEADGQIAHLLKKVSHIEKQLVKEAAHIDDAVERCQAAISRKLDDSGLRGRLQLLKELHEKGLISDDVWTRQQHELLEKIEHPVAGNSLEG